MLRGTKKKAEFARQLGLSAPVYQRYEDGRTPHADILTVISKATGKTVDWLLGKDEPIDPEHGKSGWRTQLQVLIQRLGHSVVAERVGADIDDLLHHTIATPQQQRIIHQMIQNNGEVQSQTPDDLPGIYRQIAALFTRAAELLDDQKK